MALAEDCAWTIHNLRKPDADGFMRAIGVDGRGRVVGTGDKSGVVTWEAGHPTVIGNTEGLVSTEVTDVNAAGTIVGVALDQNARAHRAYSLNAGRFAVLPLPAGFTESNAKAINGRGDILGSVTDSASHAVKYVIWRAGRPVPLAVDERSTPEDIDDGTILLNRESGPVLWNDGAERPLALPEGLNGVRATAICGGKVVGYGLPPQEAPTGPVSQEIAPQAYAHALIWVDGNPSELPGGTTATGINANGLVIGNSGQGSDAVKHVVVWTDTRVGAAELETSDGGQRLRERHR